MTPTVRSTLGFAMGIITVFRGKQSNIVISGIMVTPRPAETNPLMASISSPSKATFGRKSSCLHASTIISRKINPSGNSIKDSSL